MIIGSVDREIKLLMRYLIGKVCITYSSYYERGFLIQRECFPRFKIQQKQNWQLHNCCLFWADTCR